jgi:hypothetical protein
VTATGRLLVVRMSMLSMEDCPSLGLDADVVIVDAPLDSSFSTCGDQI